MASNFLPAVLVKVWTHRQELLEVVDSHGLGVGFLNALFNFSERHNRSYR